MTICVYEGCNKPGMFHEGTLCRTHRNTAPTSPATTGGGYTPEIPARNAAPIPIYCTRCNDTTQTLNCQRGLERCKNRTHRCKTCDACNCGIEKMRPEMMSYYTECGCFTLCPGCIATLKAYE